MARFKAGQIIKANFGSDDRASEERGIHYALIVSSELHNTVNRTLIVIPLTVQTKNENWHEHIKFQMVTDNASQPVVAMCEHITELDKKFIIDSEVGAVNTDTLADVVNVLLTNTLVGNGN